MNVCGTVLDDIADSRHKNVAGQIGFFSMEENDGASRSAL
jgi:hypothetical protein